MKYLSRIYTSVYFYFSLFKIFLSAYLKIILHKYGWQAYVEHSKKIVDLVKNCGAKVYIEVEQELKDLNLPVIIVSNHMSSLETFIFGYIFGRFFRITFVAKKSLVYYPIFGKILKYLEPILISRENPKYDYKIVTSKLQDFIRNKISLVIFPQATRSEYINEDKFSSLAIKLAERFKLDLLPVCVKTDFLSTGKILRDFGKVQPDKDVFIKIFPVIKFYQINKKTNRQLITLFKGTLAKLET